MKQFKDSPLIRDVPKKMPDEKMVAREAELGMWIAWASVRDIDYWKTRYDAFRDGVDANRTEGYYMIELRRMQPIIDRLHHLGAINLGTTVVRKNLMIGSSEERILDINKLRTAGPLMSILPGGGIFFSKVAEVVKEPHRVLPELITLPPIYKRVAGPH